MSLTDLPVNIQVLIARRWLLKFCASLEKRRTVSQDFANHFGDSCFNKLWLRVSKVQTSFDDAYELYLKKDFDVVRYTLTHSLHLHSLNENCTYWFLNVSEQIPLCDIIHSVKPVRQCPDWDWFVYTEQRPLPPKTDTDDSERFTRERVSKVPLELAGVLNLPKTRALNQIVYVIVKTPLKTHIPAVTAEVSYLTSSLRKSAMIMEEPFTFEKL